MNEPTIVILTALDLEYKSVRSHMARPQLHRHSAGTQFEVSRLAASDCRVALGLVGKGNHPAAVLAERAIAEFDPGAVLFVGVAGALRPNIHLGDVVLATHIYAYHGGTSEDDGFKARPRVWEVAHEADQLARHLARNGSWRQRLSEGAAVPEVRFGPIAAGEVVQDSRISAHARWVRQTYTDALAIEMEAAGTAQAAHMNRSLPMVVIRGISDRADGTKAATDDADWQVSAVTNAAAFATALAQELAAEAAPPFGSSSRPARTAGTAEGESMTGSTTNIASGHAQVGIQAGQVGDVSITQPSEVAVHPASRLAELRARLADARRAGDVDDGTYAAAEEEITVAADSLEGDTEQDRHRTVIALKRLQGLLAHVVDLASKAGSIITAIRGLG